MTAPAPETVAPPTAGARPSPGLVVVDVASIAAFLGLVVVATPTLEAIAGFHGLGATGRTVLREALVVLGALVALYASGKERGRASAPSGTLALGLSIVACVAAWAAAGHLAGVAPFGPGIPDLALGALRGALVVALGPLAVRLGVRHDRGEDLWRAAARLRPPEATPPLAFSIAGTQLPSWARVLLLPLVPIGLVVGLAGLLALRLYQLTLSRLMPPVCRFEPSCSRYAYDAVRRHGPVRGGALAAFRLARCQPFCKDGHDPVPPGASG